MKKQNQKSSIKYILDPITHEVLCDRRGRPLPSKLEPGTRLDRDKRYKPVFEEVASIVENNSALNWLEYWTEKDIGGYRRKRKKDLAPYFAQVAFGSEAMEGPGIPNVEEIAEE